MARRRTIAARRVRVLARKPPPCTPKPKRIRLDAEPFCARTRAYCRTDSIGSSYELGGVVPKWDARMLLVMGIVALFIWSDSQAPKKPPPELGPGKVPAPLPRNPQESLPYVRANT
jgi:hypothetical protein